MTGQGESEGERHDDRMARGKGGDPGMTGRDNSQPSVSLDDGGGGDRDECWCPEGAVTDQLYRLIGLGGGDPRVKSERESASWERDPSPPGEADREHLWSWTWGCDSRIFRPISSYMVDLLEISTAAAPVNPGSGGGPRAWTWPSQDGRAGSSRRPSPREPPGGWCFHRCSPTRSDRSWCGSRNRLIRRQRCWPPSTTSCTDRRRR